jgi:hypothetical protein
MIEQSEKKSLIASLSNSPHGDLGSYAAMASRVLAAEPDFYAHLIAWNHAKSQIRDAQIALPMLALTADRERNTHEAYVENALALLADLSPKMLVRALEFGRALRSGLPAIDTAALRALQEASDKRARSVKKRKKVELALRPTVPALRAPTAILKRFVTRYLRDLEANRGEWNRTALRHRSAVKSLYAWYSVKPGSAYENIVLFGRDPLTGASAPPPEGVFRAVHDLRSMSADEAAGTILKFKLPFLTARGAAGPNAKDPSVVMALLRVATPVELVTNTAAFERLGVKTNSALRAAFEEALERAGSKKRSPKSGTLKTTRAAEALEETGETRLSVKLRVLQERQIDNLRGIEGDWLVIGDKSGSMAPAIESARLIAATLTRLVRGAVHLVFVDESVRYIEATGKTYEELKALTSGVSANGGTCLGGGLTYISDRKLNVGGIAIVSDGGENRLPIFAQAYASYIRRGEAEPTVYFYKLSGDTDVLSHNCAAAQIDLQTFDLRGSTPDYYSLPNLAETMRIGRYSLVDEVFNTPLATLDDVLEHTKNLPVLRTFATASRERSTERITS